ncbi:MAG: hypothetical protein ABEJ99_02995 [Candidatus Nanohaloarchaea archaeon]
MSTKCKVCGRTEEELESEFGNETEFREHQGITKCSKCIREYKAMAGDSDNEESQTESKSWKDHINA